MAARDDGPAAHWSDPPGKPIRYKFWAHAADIYHGHRDGRKAIPSTSIPLDRSAPAQWSQAGAAENGSGRPADEAGQQAGQGAAPENSPAAPAEPTPAGTDEDFAEAAEGTGGGFAAAPTADAPGGSATARPGHVGTPHLLKLRSIAMELIGSERITMLRETAPLHDEKTVQLGRLEDLDAQILEARRELELLLGNPPSDEDLKERRSAEADMTRRPDRLVRERRLAEYKTRCDKATQKLQVRVAERARVAQELGAVLGRIERREAIARTRAHQIYEHTWQRVATYWQHLVRVHHYGPELNDRLRPVGPELPRWAIEPDDVRPAGTSPQPEADDQAQTGAGDASEPGETGASRGAGEGDVSGGRGAASEHGGPGEYHQASEQGRPGAHRRARDQDGPDGWGTARGRGV